MNNVVATIDYCLIRRKLHILEVGMDVFGCSLRVTGLLSIKTLCVDIAFPVGHPSIHTVQ